MTGKSLAILFCSLLCCAPAFAQAPPQSPNEQRLREQLKAALLQLRTADTERATLQAAQTDRDAKIKTLETQVQALTKQSAEDKDVAEKAATQLKEELSARTADIAKINDLLAKSDAAGKQVSDLAKKTEAQRAKLAAQAIALQRTVADQRANNAKMFETAMEVLSRYEKFGLGTALTAREPFVGITRTRLQSLVDEYDEKLSAQRIKP